MAPDVTQSDIDAIDTWIAQLTAQATDIGAEIRTLAGDASSAWFAVLYYSAVLLARRGATKLNLWRGGVLLLLPPIFGAITFVATDIVTSQQNVSIWCGAVFAFLAAITAYTLLFHVSPEEARRKRDEASHKLPYITRQIETLKSRKQSLAKEAESAAEERDELVARLEHLNEIRSAEYQREKIFQRNWRAMRSVEFEEYLAEVFQLLGYEIETTKTSGDQGVDLLAVKHHVRVAIQIKGYHSSVGNSAVQEAYAGMAHYKCQRCAVITNSRFTSSAVQLAQSTGCVLVHEENFHDFVMGRFDILEATALFS